jgi:hypothetical protein
LAENGEGTGIAYSDDFKTVIGNGPLKMDSKTVNGREL